MWFHYLLTCIDSGEKIAIIFIAPQEAIFIPPQEEYAPSH